MLPGEYEIHIHSTLSLKAKAGSTNFQQITNDEPEGHYDDWTMEEALIEELKLLGWHEL